MEEALIGQWRAKYYGAMEDAAVVFAADGTGFAEHARPMVEEREHFTWRAEGDRLRLVFHRFTYSVGDVIEDDEPMAGEWAGAWRIEGAELVLEPALNDDDRYTRVG
ncbi:hypothetical protein Afil01_26720 [Actinorhabdospora filicis]|uniref:Uncharacterized protein n=1 Tax=Actinorhabdospora filicis TaxID=1785913 RepID=A0A9W6SL13_9ACTN|nr:hypothetical protein [Actinorhabdospora filicis]GLZ77865.1 hypothetical protein Afil01_26720 [Actinorhabdospora filicis]